MANHLVHRTGNSHLPVVTVTHHGPDTESNDNISHVTDGTVGNNSLEVCLSQSCERSVNHTEDTETNNDIGKFQTTSRTNRITDANDTVSPHL